MPPMDASMHEALLNELTDKELTHERRIEILSELRADYTTVIKDDTEHRQKLESTIKENDDLVRTNSKLFRQIGTTDNEDLKKKEDEKSFSETVTISKLLGGN